MGLSREADQVVGGAGWCRHRQRQKAPAAKRQPSRPTPYGLESGRAIPILWIERADRPPGRYAAHVFSFQSAGRCGDPAAWGDRPHGPAAQRAQSGGARHGHRARLQAEASEGGGHLGQLAGRLGGAVLADLQTPARARRGKGRPHTRLRRGRGGFGRLLAGLRRRRDLRRRELYRRLDRRDQRRLRFPRAPAAHRRRAPHAYRRRQQEHARPLPAGEAGGRQAAEVAAVGDP